MFDVLQVKIENHSHEVHDYQNVHYPGQSEYVTERDVLFFNVAAVAIVEFDQSNPCNKYRQCLLVDSFHSCNILYGISILTAQVARMLGLDFAVCLFSLAGFFECTQLILL